MRTMRKRIAYLVLMACLLGVMVLFSIAAMPEHAPVKKARRILPAFISGRAPRIIKTVPLQGSTDVDPALTEITVTFDRDMAAGYSWTGGGEDFPPLAGKPRWIDKRTCARPVRLEPGRFYRIGINSQSHRKFRAVTGEPALPAAIWFCTQGASDKTRMKMRIPEAETMTPENGDRIVSPDLTEIKVTFSAPMSPGFSWTGGGDNYPEVTDAPRWSEDGLTCILPVRLRPGRDYRLGLNSPSNNNFQSRWGVPLPPVAWTFSTRGQATPAAAADRSGFNPGNR